jgi:hypothetical protein
MSVFRFAAMVCLATAAAASAAPVSGGVGYTNDFSVRPTAADWSTRSFGSTGTVGPGEITSASALDAAVQTNSASRITTPVLAVSGNPPVQSLVATWSTNGYLQTRPNGNAAILLMATFSNNTVTNATSVRITYDYRTNRAPSVAEEVRGMRVYYSLTGAENSWSNIAQLSHTAQGTLSADVVLAERWGTTSNLYLLWADDNGSGSPDDANNLDNFFLTIVDGFEDISRVAPRVAQAEPPQGELLSFNTVTITFNERVSGVDAGDLLVNGTPAANLASDNEAVYTFTFPQPQDGPVAITWAAAHGIADFDFPSKPFDGDGNTLHYWVVNPDAPVIVARAPAAGATVTNLTEISVSFNEPVNGIDAADLRVNGAPATGVSGSGANYTFTFPQPTHGTSINISWTGSAAIQDQDDNAFDGTRATNRWSYTFVDQTTPAIESQQPVAGSSVMNLTNVMVTFTEPVLGIDASDLLINGKPATNVSGSGAIYSFTFAQPNSSTVTVAWAMNHGIRDAAARANAFDATAAGATWSYSHAEAVAPTAQVTPSPSFTVRSLTRIRVDFDEPVSGVHATDLLVNNVPADEVRGSGAGPYIFLITQPATGLVQVAWAAAHGIADLSSPPNAFAGGSWAYVLDPTIQTDYAVKYAVVVSLDGLGAVYLQNYLASVPQQFPNFVRLRNESAFTMNARCDRDISETIPNHATMFTARPVFQPQGHPDSTHHGYNNNFPLATETLHNSGNTNVAYKASMFDVAHDYGRTTAFYAGKTRLGICERSYNETNGGPDTIAVGGDNGRDKIDFASVLDISGAAISNEVNMLVADLSSAAPKQFSFIHIAEPDLTGHGSGWGSVNWSNAVRMVDTQLGRILNVIDTNPVLSNQTALIVTADHGGGGSMTNGHTNASHILNYTIPFFVRAPGVPPGTDVYSLLVNRGNPGTNRTDYTTSPQPIRNGDGANLALFLVGLPPIPGSLMVPSTLMPANSMRIARFGAQLSVSWYDPLDEYALQAAEAISGASWQTIASGITLNEDTKVFTINNASEMPPRFFRLTK